MQNKNNIKILGSLSTKEIYLVSQDRDFEINEYFILEDKNVSTPIEVTEVSSSPLCIQGMMPIDVPEEYINYLKLTKEKMTYFAKAKPLNHLSKVVLTDTVRIAEFDELKHILINSDNIDESFVLGTIQGTSSMYDSMPDMYKDIAPQFKDGKLAPQGGVPFLVDPSKQREYPHSGYFGGSGSGKSFALKVTCEELMKNMIPGIVVDPHHEMEFKEKSSEYGIDYKERNDIYLMGDDIGIKFTELNVSEFIQLCEFIDPLTQPQQATLQALYENGMSQTALKSRVTLIKEILQKKENSRPDEYGEYMEELGKSRAEDLIYFEKVKDSISNSKAVEALSWKVNKLLDSGVFNTNGVSKVEKTLLQGKLAIIRGDVRRLQMVSSYLINKLYQKRRRYQDSITKKSVEEVSFFPMFFIILDEAHNFAPNGNDERMSPTKRVLKTIAQEARKYGVFEIMCTQRIGLLDTTIVAQMNNKFVFRTTNAQDLNTIKMECNLNDTELDLLPDLPSGYCIATSPTFSKNFHMKFRSTFTKSPHTLDCFNELREYNKKHNNHDEAEEKAMEHVLDFVNTVKAVRKSSYPTLIRDLSRITNKDVTLDYVLSILEKLYSIEKIDVQRHSMGDIYKSIDK